MFIEYKHNWTVHACNIQHKNTEKQRWIMTLWHSYKVRENINFAPPPIHQCTRLQRLSCSVGFLGANITRVLPQRQSTYYQIGHPSEDNVLCNLEEIVYQRPLLFYIISLPDRTLDPWMVFRFLSQAEIHSKYCNQEALGVLKFV